MSELKLRPTKASAVVDFRDEPEGISFDVQHGKSAHGIRRREHLPDFHQAAPSRFLGDAIPNVQRAGEFRVHAYGLQKLLAADDVQERSRKPLNSQFANFSRGSSRFAIRANGFWRLMERQVYSGRLNIRRGSLGCSFYEDFAGANSTLGVRLEQPSGVPALVHSGVASGARPADGAGLGCAGPEGDSGTGAAA